MIEIDNVKMWESMLKRANCIKDRTLYNLISWSLSDQGLEYKDGKIVSTIPAKLLSAARYQIAEEINVDDMVKMIQELIKNNPSGVLAGMTIEGAYRLGVEDTINKIIKRTKL